MYFVSSTAMKTTKHVILVLDILGYSDRILNSDEDKMLFDFDKMIKDVQSDLNQLIKINNQIHYKMYSDNFLIYAPLSVDDDFTQITVKGVILSGLLLQYRMLTEYGYMTRGACCVGNMYANDSYVYGSGIVKAHTMEKNHSEPTTVVSDDVRKLLLELRADRPDSKETMQMIRQINEVTFIDYLNFAIYRMNRIGMAPDCSDYVMINHKQTYDRMIRPELIKTIKRNSNDSKLKGSIEAKNKWFVDYHNTICKEGGFSNNYLITNFELDN